MQRLRLRRVPTSADQSLDELRKAIEAGAPRTVVMDLPGTGDFRPMVSGWRLGAQNK